ncbi:MAG: hypothetical protein A2286_00245 [Gammaproteobacteria bacterium RIFOXYA12_FULL_61_12]|nr:MAG: hypothetical protein A2286_00245 [Gammaproteobacteria bacterium RIFOXYA12_FULL_61_12]OGT90567.1 MAG: hypothetical protein A2514_12970 [Gammaproteobacteria bacterium RIFOXYD12_FULL_61_37]
MKSRGIMLLVVAGLLGSMTLAAQAETVEVIMQKYSFQPQELRIKAGDSIRWVNREKRQFHSVLFPGQAESDYLFPGDTFEKAFPAPGVYPYHCGPHPEMTGTVHVD